MDRTIDYQLNMAMLLLNAVEVKGEQNLNNVLAAIQRIRNARKMLKEVENIENRNEQRKELADQLDLGAAENVGNGHAGGERQQEAFGDCGRA